MVTIDDIIWLESVVEKLAWKHRVLTSEVEEVLIGQCRIFKKETGKVEGEHLYNVLGRTRGGRYLSVFFIRKLKLDQEISKRDLLEREIVSLRERVLKLQQRIEEIDQQLKSHRY